MLPSGMAFRQAVLLGYLGRFESRSYLDWLKTLPCHKCDTHPPSDPSHTNTGKGIGTKSPDWFALPECRPCHEWYTAHPSNEEHQRRMALVPFYLMQAIFEGRLVWSSRSD